MRQPSKEDLQAASQRAHQPTDRSPAIQRLLSTCYHLSLIYRSYLTSEATQHDLQAVTPTLPTLHPKCVSFAVVMPTVAQRD